MPRTFKLRLRPQLTKLTMVFCDDDANFDSGVIQTFQAASQEAARKGGAILMEMLGKAEVWEKGPGDLVTKADYESQHAIESYLNRQFPDHVVLGEESTTDSINHAQQQELCWIVDPLDGTTNFVHQLRSFSVSVALRHRFNGQDQLLAGSVFDPTTDECFSAGHNLGATLNSKPIQVSGCQELKEALAVFSMSSRIPRTDIQIQRLLNVLPHVSSIRRLGSAALNLCFVACGRTDAYWATTLKCWDVAAGWLIAKEAGAVLRDFTGDPLNLDRPHFCLTATDGLFDEIRPYLDIESSP